jgi:ATP-binding cassette subfamily B protein
MQKLIESKKIPDKLIPFVWSYLRHKKWYLAGFILVSLIWAIEMSLSPYLLKIIIDSVVNYSQDKQKIVSAIFIPALLYVLMTVVINLNFRLYDYINLRLYPYLKSAVDKDMFEYLMHHSHTFFQNTFAGNLTKKIADMAENIEPLVSIPNEWFYPRLFALLIASITLFIVVHPIFGIILFVWAVSFVYVSYITARKSERFARQFAEAVSTMGGTISDSVSNIMSIKLFANIPHEISHLEKDINQLKRCDTEWRWYDLKINFIQGIGLTILIAAMLIALIYGNMQGYASPGDFALVLMLSIAFMWGVHDVGKQMQRFAKVVGTCNQALTFIQIPHEITDAPHAKPLVITNGEIRFEDITFKYEKNKSLFNHLSITLRPGEKVGLVGYSGGGKSTFIKLILRLIDPQSGHILIDNQDIKAIQKQTLRKQIGTIPQEPELFHRTIMENIRFAKPDATDEEVIDAAKHAHCHEFVMDLPEQYHSLVGERGVKLSGGQKQRIAIARAFLKNAPILLLDEATSSLDSVTERFIQEGLHAVMSNKTTIVIAHRLSTLKDMDRILVFVNGNIVEDGNLPSLLENKESHFYKLWQMQAQGFIPVI